MKIEERKERTIDYLREDDPINGQKFMCISFVEPSIDKLSHKESYMFHNFMEHYGHILYIQFCKHHGLKPDSKLNIELDEIYERYTDFKAMKYKEVCEKYEEKFGDESHIRMVKVRGSYPSKAVADMQGKKLRNGDPSFDVFTTEVGKWVPFNPININDIEPEYMEEKMQQLVKTHLEQENKKEELFEERKQKMLEKVKVESKEAVEVLEETDESNKETTNNNKRRKRKDLPPKLKAKLQQQLLDSQIADNCIEIEKIEKTDPVIDDQISIEPLSHSRCIECQCVNCDCDK